MFSYFIKKRTIQYYYVHKQYYNNWENRQYWNTLMSTVKKYLNKTDCNLHDICIYTHYNYKLNENVDILLI